MPETSTDREITEPRNAGRITPIQPERLTATRRFISNVRGSSFSSLRDDKMEANTHEGSARPNRLVKCLKPLGDLPQLHLSEKRVADLGTCDGPEDNPFSLCTPLSTPVLLCPSKRGPGELLFDQREESRRRSPRWRPKTRDR